MTEKADRRARLEELLGELFDLADDRQPRDMTIGQQAEKRRRREQFQAVGIKLLREVVLAAREPAKK